MVAVVGVGDEGIVSLECFFVGQSLAKVYYFEHFPICSLYNFLACKLLFFLSESMVQFSFYKFFHSSPPPKQFTKTKENVRQSESLK